jgi:hypothetical protein
MPCPVCGKTEFSYANSYEICDVCQWENEEFATRHPDETSEANNPLSLNEYRAEWEKNGKVVLGEYDWTK